MKAIHHVMPLLRLSGGRKWFLACAVLCGTLSVLLQLTPYVAVYFMFSDMLGLETVQLSFSVTDWGWLSLLALVLSGIAMYASSVFSHMAAFDMIYQLRLALLQKVSALPIGKVRQRSRGEWKGLILDETNKLEAFIAHYLPDMISASLYIVVIMSGLFLLDWRLALAMSLPIAAAVAIQSGSFRHPGGAEVMNRFFASMQRMNGTIVEYVRGLPVLKTFNRTGQGYRKLVSDVNSFAEHGQAYSMSSIPSFALFLVTLPAAFVLLVPISGWLLTDHPHYGSMLSKVLLFLLLSNGLFVPLLKMMFVGSRTRQLAHGLGHIELLMKEAPMPEPKTDELPVRFDVELDKVGFGYGETEVLRGVSLRAEQGKVTALVGRSGAGKSTVAQLIGRFWDVSEGAVRIGGTDVRALRTGSLNELISFVQQDNHVFADTILNNIRMGQTEASLEEVRAAAHAAQCDFIDHLPQGFETRVGIGGRLLSGGEKQRLAIARLILKNRPILLLDEATAHADAENEYKIQQALATLMAGKTVLVIAHRLSTIREADHIVVLDEGKVTESGNHESLLEANDLYASLWRREQAAMQDKDDVKGVKHG